MFTLINVKRATYGQKVIFKCCNYLKLLTVLFNMINFFSYQHLKILQQITRKVLKLEQESYFIE